MSTRLLNYREAAEIYGLSEISVKRYAAIGLIPVVRFSKRMVRIPQDKLEIFIEGGGINTMQNKQP